MYTSLKFNLANAPIRHETLQGRAYLVAPLAMITEGVHNGSGGALLYKEGELKKAAPAWNMKPIVVYHPELNGRGISACDPVVLEKQQVGMVMNTRWAGKLRAEAWIEKDRADVVDNRIIKALEANQMMEVSTGLFTDNVGGPGKWQEKEYVAEATNHQPDHLALLPDQIGACSIADGAGLLQMNEAASGAGVDVTRLMAREMDHMRRVVGNAMSNSNVFAALSGALRGRYPPTKKADGYTCGPYIVDVYPDFFVFEMDGPAGVGMRLYRLNYTAKKDDVTIDEGTPEEVVRVTEYRTADNGKFVGNEAYKTKERKMEKKKVVDGLIGNEATGWEEADRAALMAMDDAVLNKMAYPKKKKPGNKAEDAVDGGADDTEETVDNAAQAAATGTKSGKGTKGTPATNAAPQTAQEYVNAAPPAIRDMLTNGLAVHDAEKERHIAVIVANKANKFSKEFLATKGLGELQGLSALCVVPETAVATPGTVPMFFGAATPAGVPVVTNATTEGPLPLPTMNFERKK